MPTPKNGKVPNSGEFRGRKFWTLPFLGVASPGLSQFRGWPIQDSVYFWILAHKEIWRLPEGWVTLYTKADLYLCLLRTAMNVSKIAELMGTLKTGGAGGGDE